MYKYIAIIVLASISLGIIAQQDITMSAKQLGEQIALHLSPEMIRIYSNFRTESSQKFDSRFFTITTARYNG